MLEEKIECIFLTDFITMVFDIQDNVFWGFLFNDALNTFYLRLYGVGHMVKDHSDSERGNLLPPHGLLFLIKSKGSFICTIPQTGRITHTPALAEIRNSPMGPP